MVHTGGDDFTLLTQEISFVNESEQFVSLLIDDDNKLEELEEVRLTLEVIGDDTRVSLQESTTTLFIVDDDRKLYTLEPLSLCIRTPLKDTSISKTLSHVPMPHLITPQSRTPLY